MAQVQLNHQTNLPAHASSFIGRERELSEIERLLRRRRLVTLTGVGGTGKTRLALHAAAAELDRFADGVWLIELAPLGGSELVVETIGQALGVPTTTDSSPLGGLCAFLRAKQLLLVLDNCEHVIVACAQIVADVLSQCPSVTVLVTSREPLGIAGEWILRVPPLELPDPSQVVDPERLLRYDGIHFFVERAQAAEPSFRLTAANAASVTDICRRLDGIPLALELAAVRVRGMGVAYLSARLDDRFRLLTGGDRASAPRHQALHTSLDWSYSLLSEPERVVLRRLAVFSGTFPLEAAEGVCAGEYVSQNEQATVLPEVVVELLLQLVDKSLTQLDQESGRYSLLETIRLYAHERLDEAGETNDANRRHFACYLHLAKDSAALVGGPNQGAWFTRIEQEHDNFRAALGWALDARQADEAAQMALALWRFWHARTYQREGLRWLERILALDATNPLPDVLRPHLFNAVGVLAHRAARIDRAHTCHAEALRLWTAAGDRVGMAQALFDIGWLRRDQVELDSARQCAAQSLFLAESIGDNRLIASALGLGAVVDIESSQLRSAPTGVASSLPQEVIPAIERSLAIWRELGDADNLASTLAVLAVAHQLHGDYERAKPLLAESARLHAQLGSYGNLINTLVALMQQAAGTAEQMEMARDAARMMGVLAAWEETTSGTPSPWWTTAVGQALIEKVTRRLGPEAFAQALTEGKSLTTVGFLALADRITSPDTQGNRAPQQRGSTPYATLSAREVEVLRLVATGLTNARVAERLTVTSRTVNAHLTAIYGKLGVTGRSGAIRYALDHQLS